LRQRNFRLFFGGQVVSMAGTWMQTVALSWLVLQLSGNSGLAVGLVFSFQYLPTLFLGAYGGVFIDAFDKRKVMAVTQVIQTTAAVLLAVLTFTGVVELWMVYAITMLNGLALVVDNPARVTIVSELVGDEDLSNALGLNNAVVQTARIAGPALAGVVILVSGTAMCFAVNALSFLAMLAALAALDPSKMHRKPPLGRHKGQMRDGLHYIWNRRDLRAALLLMTVIGTLSFNMSVITPLMAKLEFDGDAATLSWMIIALGCGALVGALVFASRASVTPRLMVYSGLVFGGLLVLCALSPTLAAFLGVLAFVGAVQTVFLTATNSIIQLRAEPSMRGRVMGVYNVTVLGSTPIGGPLIGLLGQTFGPRWAFMVEAGGVFVGMAAFGTMFLRACRRQGDSYEQSVLPDSDHVVVAPAPAVGPAPAPSPG
jgi:MFS family permease